MKSVLRIKNKHPASFRYYKVMKGVVADGLDFIEEERERTAKALEGMKKEGKEYAKLRGMQNVLSQFEKVEFIEGHVVRSERIGHNPDEFESRYIRLCRQWKEKCDGEVLCTLVWSLPCAGSYLCTYQSVESSVGGTCSYCGWRCSDSRDRC